jgi:hypothetical protein
LPGPVPGFHRLYFAGHERRACCAQAQRDLRAMELHPRVYFSPRRSPAPDTEGGAAAEAGGAGCGAVAGVGAAWLWRGELDQAM